MKSSRTSRVAASAALTSVAAAGASQAEILYSGLVNQTVYSSGTTSSSFDLDLDGANDFNLTLTLGANKPTVTRVSSTQNPNPSAPLVRVESDFGLPITPPGVTVDGGFLDQSATSGYLYQFPDLNSPPVVGDWGAGGTATSACNLGPRETTRMAGRR